MAGNSIRVNTDQVAQTAAKMEALNRRPDASPEELLDCVSDAIEEFMGDAPRFDDASSILLSTCLKLLVPASIPTDIFLNTITATIIIEVPVRSKGFLLKASI